jgi:hypothetical protein
MPSQHKHRPIAFRPPEGDRAWLLEYALRTGRPVNAILAEALADKRAEAGLAERLAAARGVSGNTL